MSERTELRPNKNPIAYFPPSYLRNYEEWIRFPQQNNNVVVNRILMPFKWPFWTNRALLTSDGENTRARLANQYSVLGSTAGMLVTVSAAAFYFPPPPNNEGDDLFIDIFGFCMFFATVMFLSYIILSLTVLFPLIESAKDELTDYIFHELLKNVGNIEGLLFVLGVKSFVVGLVAVVPVIYPWVLFYIIAALTVIIYCVTVLLSIWAFICIDPITSMHMGIAGDASTLERAETFAEIIEELNRDSKSSGHLNAGEAILNARRQRLNSTESGENQTPEKEALLDASPQPVLATADQRLSVIPETQLTRRRGSTMKFLKPRIAPVDDQSQSSPSSPTSRRSVVSRNSVVMKSHAAVRRIVKIKKPDSMEPKYPNFALIESLPSLDEIFKDPEKRLTADFIPSPQESLRVLDCLLGAGFQTTEEIVEYLKFVGGYDDGDDDASHGSNNNNYAKVRCLTALGIKSWHAYKLVRLLDDID